MQARGESVMRAASPRKEEPASTAGSAAGVRFLAGAFGGTMAATLTNPLEVVKTRLQSATAVKMRWDRMLVHIVRTEGFPALFRGLFANVIGVGPARATYFASYTFFKDLIADKVQGTAQHASAAALASLVTSSVTSPIWVVKTRLQLQSTPTRAWGILGRPTDPRSVVATAAATAAAASAPNALPPYKGIVHAFKTVYREEGFRALFKGLTAAYLGVFESALQLALYESMKEAYITRVSGHALPPSTLSASAASAAPLLPLAPGGLRAARGPAGGAATLDSTGTTDPADGIAGETTVAPSPSRAALTRTYYSPTVAFLIGAASKLMASVITYPHEVLRTRLREQRGVGRYRGVVHAVTTIWREEGRRGLYGGMAAHLLRTVPNAAILFLVVEAATGGGI